MLLIKTNRIEFQKKLKILFELNLCPKADMSESTYKIILFSFCFLKQSASKAANGVSKVRAFCGHPFTQAQQRIHFSTSVLHSSPFAMAPAGQCFTQYPQWLQSSVSTAGMRGIGTPLLRSFTTFRKKRNNGKTPDGDVEYG